MLTFIGRQQSLMKIQNIGMSRLLLKRIQSVVAQEALNTILISLSQDSLLSHLDMILAVHLISLMRPFIVLAHLELDHFCVFSRLVDILTPVPIHLFYITSSYSSNSTLPL